MATKVEELRDKLETAISTAVENGTYDDGLVALDVVDPLISAARAEGYLAGYKDARNERDYDPLGVDYTPLAEKEADSGV
jgi:hypothetical protein